MLTTNWPSSSSGHFVEERIGKVAYKLSLPPGASIHPVFHVSQLKVAVPVTHTTTPLPDSIDGLQVPQRILQKRVASSGADVRLQALIQWIGLPAALATWEDVEALRQRFPGAPAWGQAGSQRGGDTQHQPHLCPALTEKTSSARTSLKMGRGGEQGDAGPTCVSKAQTGRDAAASHRRKCSQVVYV